MNVGLDKAIFKSMPDLVRVRDGFTSSIIDANN